jgi:hypothetical protein
MDGKKYIGIDVHQESISIAVSKDAGSDGDHHVECRAVDAVSARIGEQWQEREVLDECARPTVS